MQEERFDGSSVITEDVVKEEIEAALTNEANRSVTVHRGPFRVPRGYKPDRQFFIEKKRGRWIKKSKRL